MHIQQRPPLISPKKAGVILQIWQKLPNKEFLGHGAVTFVDQALLSATNFVVGVLPLRNYSDDYVALVSPVLRALDALDTHLRRRMNDLLDPSSVRHAEVAAKLDTKRIAVLTAGNKVFTAHGIELVPIGR